ncbi:hypothetical protein X801_00851, partial [Opisthorchis viverrini]
MFVVATLLILAATCLLTSASQHTGDRQPISSEDFTSQTFGKLVEEANYWCNYAINHEKWHKRKGDLDGTKSVAPGIIYELHIRQRGTQCMRTEMLERGFNGKGSMCVAQNNGNWACKLICFSSFLDALSVSGSLLRQPREKPWTNSMEITDGDIWLVDVIDEVSSETVKKCKSWNWGKFWWMIRDTQIRIDNRDVDKSLYELSTVTESLQTICYSLQLKDFLFSVEE